MIISHPSFKVIVNGIIIAEKRKPSIIKIEKKNHAKCKIALNLKALKTKIIIIAIMQSIDKIKTTKKNP